MKIRTFRQTEFLATYLFSVWDRFFLQFWKITSDSFLITLKRQVVQKCGIPVFMGFETIMNKNWVLRLSAEFYRLGRWNDIWPANSGKLLSPNPKNQLKTFFFFNRKQKLRRGRILGSKIDSARHKHKFWRCQKLTTGNLVLLYLTGKINLWVLTYRSKLLSVSLRGFFWPAKIRIKNLCFKFFQNWKILFNI